MEHIEEHLATQPYSRLDLQSGHFKLTDEEAVFVQQLFSAERHR